MRATLPLRAPSSSSNRLTLARRLSASENAARKLIYLAMHNAVSRAGPNPQLDEGAAASTLREPEAPRNVGIRCCVMTTDRSKVIGEVYPGAKNGIDRMVRERGGWAASSIPTSGGPTRPVPAQGCSLMSPTADQAVRRRGSAIRAHSRFKMCSRRGGGARRGAARAFLVAFQGPACPRGQGPRALPRMRRRSERVAGRANRLRVRHRVPMRARTAAPEDRLDGRC
jgi:hypothetical protein